LVGAIALVSFVVIILPLILDKEPGPAGPPLNVQIPSQESGGFDTRALPPAAPASEKTAEIAAAKAEPPPATVALAAPKAGSSTPKAESSAPGPAAAGEIAKVPGKTEELRAQAALNDQTWIVPLDAFSDMKNVRQLRTKLSAVGVKSYTEPVKTSKGELTRVRAGPFASKEAAEKARAKLEAMGLKPGVVASR
jgi:DedD protein